MKSEQCCLLLLTMFLFVFCKNRSEPSINQVHLKPRKSKSIDEPNEVNTQPYKTHIIDREGVVLKEDTSKSAKVLGHLSYGTQVKVYDSTSNWLGIWARIDRVKTMPDGIKYNRQDEEKIYIPKRSTGQLTELKLVPSDLNKIVSITRLREKIITHIKPQPLQEFLRFELAYKAEYLSNKANRVEQLIKDSTGVKVKGKQLTLQFASKQRTYENENDENGVEYEYVGQIPAINKYVIRAIYWESLEYILIDRTSGEESIRPHEFPHLSPDGKYLIVFDDDVFKFHPEVELYSVNEATIEPIVNLAFANWSLPEAPESSGFWGKDGYFYIPVIHRNYFDFYGNEIKDKIQYMRIKIL